MSTMYLVTFQDEFDFMAEFMNIERIADLYGNADGNETINHKVYRLTPKADPERLFLRKDHGVVSLYDSSDNTIEQAIIPEFD